MYRSVRDQALAICPSRAAEVAGRLFTLPDQPHYRRTFSDQPITKREFGRHSRIDQSENESVNNFHPLCFGYQHSQKHSRFAAGVMKTRVCGNLPFFQNTPMLHKQKFSNQEFCLWSTVAIAKWVNYIILFFVTPGHKKRVLIKKTKLLMIICTLEFASVCNKV